MSTKGCQAQAPAGGGGGANKAPTARSTPPPRRGHIKENIIKDVVAAVVRMAAGLVARADKNGGGGLPVAGDADGK
jgi:hypothetical protein